ncbi:MAG: two pore domain potassium channel family protein [Proteobacteria bacterium]|nr:two pore domain potassium channel family protein [Pseudomonadota bacterium]
MLIISFSHMLSAFAYSLFYYAMDNHWGMGSLVVQNSDVVNTFTIYDYFYYSLTVYTSLGFGDITPTGGLRILSGLETMNGLMMITWSASYTYIVMTRHIDMKNSHTKERHHD